jgi:hypothetical protein
MRSFRLPLPVVLTLTAVVDGAAILAAASAWLVLASALGNAWLIAAMVTLPLVAWGAAFASIAGTKLIVDLAFDATYDADDELEAALASGPEAAALALQHAR